MNGIQPLNSPFNPSLIGREIPNQEGLRKASCFYQSPLYTEIASYDEIGTRNGKEVFGSWIPAFAGMTNSKKLKYNSHTKKKIKYYNRQAEGVFAGIFREDGKV
jgi:hypothetical protein